MVKLRSGSVIDLDTMTDKMTADEFALLLIDACKLPDVRDMLMKVVAPNNEQFLDKVSTEVHRQLTLLREQLKHKDEEILRLKKTISDQQVMLDNLEQHGRRDSLRITGIPENPEHDDTDGAVLSVCQQIKVDPPVEPRDIVVSHRVGKSAGGRPRQILVKFATRNVRERVFKARTALKMFNKDNEEVPNIYINDDLTQLQAGLARDARSLKTNNKINDTWTIYGKVMIKDNHGHVKTISKPDDLIEYANW